MGVCNLMCYIEAERHALSVYQIYTYIFSYLPNLDVRENCPGKGGHIPKAKKRKGTELKKENMTDHFTGQCGWSNQLQDTLRHKPS